MILILDENFGRWFKDKVPYAHRKSKSYGKSYSQKVNIVHLRARLYSQVCCLSDRYYKDKYKKEENKQILKISRVNEVIFISVVRMGFVAELSAFFQNGFVLLFAHAFLKVVGIQGVPSQMAITLPRRISFNYNTMRHRNWNFYFLFLAAEVKLSFNLKKWYIVQIIFKKVDV